MFRSKTRKIILLVFSVFLVSQVSAQDLIYTPINPAFGGNTFNHQWLMNSAQAQNPYKEEDALDPLGSDPLADFQDRLNRQILNELSRSLVDNILGSTGEDGQFQEGTFEIGDFIIEVTEGLNGVNITIFDLLSGGETSFFIPF